MIKPKYQFFRLELKLKLIIWFNFTLVNNYIVADILISYFLTEKKLPYSLNYMTIMIIITRNIAIWSLNLNSSVFIEKIIIVSKWIILGIIK